MDNVKHPAHYCGQIETIDYIKDKLGTGFVPYCIGNVMKYVSRYDKKGKPVEDLEKAAVYLNWAIESLKEQEKTPAQSLSKALFEDFNSWGTNGKEGRAR